jgi:hypothetical protein
MTFLYALRYFQVVAVVPRLFLVGFVVTVGAAVVRLTSDPSMAVEALTPVLMFQLFAASSGFRIGARRGYYDLLLTSGVPRWQVAVAHCLASVLPGFIAWICVLLLEVAASHGSSFRSAATGSTLTVVGLSLLAWAAAIAVSRATAAVGWLLIMTVPPIARLASPAQWLGLSSAHPGWITALAIVAVAMPVTIASACITRMSIPLDGSQ